MECSSSKEEEFVVDIENLELKDEGQVKLCKKVLKKSLSKVIGGSLGVSASNTNVDSSNVLRELGRLENGENRPLVQKERQIGGKAQRPPKPPRPPKGPSLDAADMRFVKEISRIALKKKERIQQLNQLKKVNKAGKPASSSSSLFSPSSGSALLAMVVTIVFFLVLIFQGLSGSSSSVVFVGAPQSAPEKAFSPISSSHRSS